MTYFIDTPLVTDILCGKDKSFGKNPGNRAYRNLIEIQAVAYANEPSKQNKMQMTKDIVARLEAEGARFIRKCGDDCWEEISNQQARDKTSHALRFCAASLNKKKSKATKSHRRTVSTDDSIDAVEQVSQQKIPEAAAAMFQRQQQLLQMADFVHTTSIIIPEEPVMCAPEPVLSSFRTSSAFLESMLREPLDHFVWD